MNVIQSARQLNDQGLSLLQQDTVNATRAALCFQNGLARIRHLMMTISTDNDDNEDQYYQIHQREEDSNASPTLMIPQTLHESQVSLSGLEHQGIINKNDDSSYYTYACPLRLEEYQNGQDMLAYLILASAQLLFNLALTTHHRGRTATTTQAATLHRSRDECMTAAAKLYSTIPDLVESLWEVSSAARTLCLLALNNEVQIRVEQCQYLEATECMGRLSKLLAVLHDDDKDNEGMVQHFGLQDEFSEYDGGDSHYYSYCPLDTLDMNEILLNVLAFHHHPLVAARAA